MELKKGYKQSELGPIPEDWIECSFVDAMTGFSSGQTPYRAIEKYYKGDIPWITSGELNYNAITDTIEKITKEAVIKTNLKIIPKGTFLFAITGLEAEGTRGSCGIVGVDATTNQSCMALYPKTGMLTTDYLYQFYLKYGNWLAFNYCQGTKQQSYTGGIAKKLPIILPPSTDEQDAITIALKDMDNLINSLSTLIEKKKAIKQGAMQQFLKPKEEWNYKPLGEMAAMSSGGTPLTSVAKYYDGEIPWVVIADITNAGKYIESTEKFISLEGLANSSAKLFKKGVLLFAMYASIGKCTISKIDTTCNQAILGIETKTINTQFLYYYLSFHEKKFISMGQTGTQSNLNKEIVKELIIPHPDIIEQERIAMVLSDIDEEIFSLETQLHKNIMLKQGMMQELLTGKIRLV